jgi:hypothetical protein
MSLELDGEQNHRIGRAGVIIGIELASAVSKVTASTVSRDHAADDPLPVAALGRDEVVQPHSVQRPDSRRTRAAGSAM